MAVQYSQTICNARLNLLESSVGASPLLRIYTGTQPANCAAAASGTLLATLTLPADWLTTATTGSIAKVGTWEGTASAAGTAGHFRLLNSAGTVVHMQGTCGQASGDLSLDNTIIANLQPISVTAFNVTAAGQ